MCITVNKMLKGDSVGSNKKIVDPILLRATKSWSKKLSYIKTEAVKIILLSVLRDAEE
jgi:hypothetical protein